MRNFLLYVRDGYDVETDREISRQRFGSLPGFASRHLSLLDVLRDRRTYNVALVCVANGANNLSIYIPLFASLHRAQLPVVLLILYGFVALWLLLSFRLTRTPALALVLNRYAPMLFPFVLIWLGLRILRDSGSPGLLG
jgi:cadmium resistance protein CadD (predicted permease)